jgi:hypothetical protein
MWEPIASEHLKSHVAFHSGAQRHMTSAYYVRLVCLNRLSKHTDVREDLTKCHTIESYVAILDTLSSRYEVNPVCNLSSLTNGN